MTSHTAPMIEALTATLTEAQFIDLTHPLEEGMPTYPTHTKYFQNRWEAMGDTARMHQLILGEHTGTHVDSPSHFPTDSGATWSIDTLPPLALSGRCLTIHLDPPPAEQEMVESHVLERWERNHHPIEQGDIVLLDFGWARDRWTTGPAGFAHLTDWPGLARSAAELLRDRGVRAAGTDCVSLDTGDGGRGELPAHLTLLPAGIPIVENVANPDALPDVCFFLAMPLRIAHGTGSPVRAVAVLDGGHG